MDKCPINQITWVVVGLVSAEDFVSGREDCVNQIIHRVIQRLSMITVGPFAEVGLHYQLVVFSSNQAFVSHLICSG